MSIRVSNIRLGIEEPELALVSAAATALAVRPADIARWRILRKSLDVRDKRDIAYVYSLEVALAEQNARALGRLARPARGVVVESYSEPPFEMPPSGEEPLSERPIIVGSGPAGVFAAYFLAERGYRPLVLERGRP